MSQLNTQSATYGISASIATDGTLQFGGSTAFTVTAGALANGASAGAVATPADTAYNTGNYSVDSATALNASAVAGGAFVGFAAGGTGSETISIQNGKGTTSVTLSGAANAGAGNATTLVQALQTLNTALNGTGISAVQNAGGTGVSFQSSSSFNITLTAESTGGVGNLFGSGAAASGQCRCLARLR